MKSIGRIFTKALAGAGRTAASEGSMCSVTARCKNTFSRSSMREFQRSTADCGRGPASAPSTFSSVRRISQDGGRRLQMASARPALQLDDFTTPRLMISRIMHQDDVQMFGAVHGGMILQLAEEAGTILSEQYCNRFVMEKKNEATTLLGSLEKAEFLLPMFSGELGEVYAEVGYTSPHSIQIITSVYAKKISEGAEERRLVNRTRLWFVPVSKEFRTHKVMSVPPVTYTDPEKETSGRIAYEKMKKLREVIRPRPGVNLWKPMQDRPTACERFTADFSLTTMTLAVHPSSCLAGTDFCRGGVIMKVMDECGCFTSITHASYFCYTISFDTVSIFRKIKVGSVLIATSKLIFSSSRSLEARVTVDEMRVEPGKGLVRERAAEAILTFISVEGFGKLRELPQLKPITEEEVKLFQERKQLYEDRKKEKSA